MALQADGIRDHLRARGLRWTPQRGVVLDVLVASDGHVTGAELVERCRERDAATTPSTVYRTLDVLEEIGLVRHGHGPEGREEYHVGPGPEHGHLYCDRCGEHWEIEPADAAELIRAVHDRHGVTVDLSHVTVVGRCAGCAENASR
jgi:Fur family ferric uptake transcriptional regulator